MVLFSHILPLAHIWENSSHQVC